MILIERDPAFAPENCRWTTRRERRPNASATKIAAFGEMKTATEWARDPRCAVSRPTLRDRLLESIPPEIGMPARSKWHSALPKAEKPVITSRTLAGTDWDLALHLRVKEGLGLRDIAARLGVPYPTIQVGLLQRLGPAVTPGAPKSHDRRRLYQIWRSLRMRTTDPLDPKYRANGALGVRVCREWRSFEAFRSWAVRSGWKPGLCLARVRLRGSYSPANCEWITRRKMSERYRSVWRR